jgi:hypothetical protein
MRALLLSLTLIGCSHSAVVVTNASPVVRSSTVNASGAIAAGVIIGTAAIAASQDGSGVQGLPEMAPERAVALQDCTKPVDFTAGNLRCR